VPSKSHLVFDSQYCGCVCNMLAAGLSIFFIIASASAATGSDEWCKEENAIIVGDKIWKGKVKTTSECETKCQAESQCVGYTHKMKKGKILCSTHATTAMRNTANGFTSMFKPKFSHICGGQQPAPDATVYIVDGENGNDNHINHNGLSKATAFKTIQHCVDKLLYPGDECQIAEGRYHEVVKVDGLRASEDKPIKITGLGNDRPVWDGTVLIEPKEWDFDSATRICSAKIEQDITALFLNDDLLTAARWPNALWSNKTVFNNKYWGHSDRKSTRGKMIDNGHAGLASSGIDATGAMAILNIGSYNTFVAEVQHHDPTENFFLYNDTFGDDLHFKPHKNQYYLEAKKEFLDSPQEWFYNKTSKMLYLIPDNDKTCPDSSVDTLRGRTMDYGLVISLTTGLTVSNINFFASNINAMPDNNIKQNDYVTLENLNIRFGASSHRMLKDAGIPQWTKVGGVNKVSVINSNIFGSEGAALSYKGKAYIHNNYIAWNDWTGQMLDTKGGGKGTVFAEYGTSSGDVITHNTLYYNGASAGIRPGYEPTVAYNHVMGQCSGSIQNDGAGIQLGAPLQDGSYVHHNWVRDSPKMGVRFDGQNEQQGQNGRAEYNLAYDCSGFIMKGNNHTIRNNMAFGKYAGEFEPDEKDGCNLCVIYKLRHFPQILNNDTRTLNNGATVADGGKNVEEGGRWPLPGKVIENNYFGDNVEDNLYDIGNLDFRPLENSNLTKTDDVIGPYLPGYQTFYWIPGQKLQKTSTPIPPSGSTVSADRDVVMFLGSYKADKYKWFFGIKEDKVRSAKAKRKISGYYKGDIEEGVNVLELPELKSGKTYHWRVDTYVGDDVYTGDVWSFTTA